MRAKTMSYQTKLLKAEEDEEQRIGRVHALVSVFGNVDWDGDRIIRGAFADSLTKWRESGDPLPWIWSHQWHDPAAHIGWVPPELARETDRGLEVTAYMDLNDTSAARVYTLLKGRRVTQFSFAFDVLEERETDEETDRGWVGNVVDLLKLDIFEAGPTLLGANSETDLLEVATRRRSRSRVRGASRQRLVDAQALIQEAIDAWPEDEEGKRKERYDRPEPESEAEELEDLEGEEDNTGEDAPGELDELDAIAAEYAA